MKSCAYIIDAYSRGSYHEVINQGYLMMISSIYNHVTYIGDSKACQNLRNLMDECDYNYSNVVFKEKNFRTSSLKIARSVDYIIHLIYVSVLCYYYYLRTPAKADVFFNNNLNFAIPMIQFFSFGKKNRIVDLCHNELEQIDKKKMSGKIGFVLNKLYRLVFFKINLSPKFKFLLLSSDMAKYFKNFIAPYNYSNVGWIDHCYIRPLLNFDNKENLKGNIKIGIPGYVAPGRGLIELKEVLKNVVNKDIFIYAIGRVSERLKSPFFQELNQTNQLMSFDMYNAYVKQMDVLMLCYSSNSYTLTASGAVLEAIWNEKPIFAIENAYFNYLFEKFGALGVLAKDSEALADSLNRITKNDILLYSKNLKNAKEKLRPEQVKFQLLKELD